MLAMLIAAAVAAQTPPSPPGRPQLLRGPGPAEIRGVYPPEAKAAGVEGQARVRCVATAEGTLSGCAVVDESPEGRGFGAAVIKVAPLFRFAPTKSDGSSIKGERIVVPIRFSLKPPPGAVPATAEGRLEEAMRATMTGAPIPGHDVIMVKAPTADSIKPYWPTGAKTKNITGAAQIDCTVAASGRLEKCFVMRETPEGLGFGAAAVALFTNEVVVAEKTRSGASTAGRKVQPTIRFQTTGSEAAAAR